MWLRAHGLHLLWLVAWGQVGGIVERELYGVWLLWLGFMTNEGTRLVHGCAVAFVVRNFSMVLLRISRVVHSLSTVHNLSTGMLPRGWTWRTGLLLHAHPGAGCRDGNVRQMDTQHRRVRHTVPCAAYTDVYCF